MQEESRYHGWAWPIERVAGQRVSCCRTMRAYLMGAPSMRLDAEQRKTRQPPQRAVGSAGRLPARGDAHQTPVIRITCQGCVDQPIVCSASMHQRQVALFKPPAAERALQRAVRLCLFWHTEQSRGIPIEPMQ